MNKSILTLIAFLFISVNALSQVPLVQQIINATSQDSLVYFVRELSGDVQTTVNGSPVTIISRNKNQPTNDVAKDYIRQKLESYGLNTTIQSFSSTGKNVIGAQLGTEFPNQKFIICAHYDDMPSGTTAPGADDNASGTAGVIEAARVLSPHSFPFTILYALWDEEEQGLIGSDYYATQAASAGDSILGVINLDMIAWDLNPVDGICNIHTADVGITFDIYDKMVEINSLYNVGLNIVEVYPEQPYSDHHSFIANGYAAVLLIEDDNDFNAYYHTTNDKVMYFNQPYYHKMAKLAIASLATFALNLNLNIIHTPIASTAISSDINTSMQVISGLNIATVGAGAPRLYYRLDIGGGFGQFIEIVGTPALENLTINFTIPAPPLGSKVQYYLAAQDENSTISVTLPAGGGGFNPPGNTPPSEFFQFYVGPFIYALNDNASNLNNWSHTGSWGTTTSKFTSPPSSFTDSPTGNYSANVTSDLTYNGTISLTNALGAYLEFETQWSIETDWDYGMVQISTNGGTNWTALEGNYTNPGTGSFQPNGQPLYDGTQTAWVHETMDISNYLNQQVKIRFYFRSDGSVQQDGWYIDDIKVTVFQPVPVELIAFNAAASENSVDLNWITASEINNNGFEIERQRQAGSKQYAVGNQWEKIGFVKGSGTSTEAHNYIFKDDNPLFGISWYRLKQIDLDGSSEYYGPIKVDNTTLISFKLWQNYPNPFNPTTNIKFVNQKPSFVTLKVFDVLGNEVAVLLNEEKEPGFYSIEFNASNLASGTYIYRLQAGENVMVKKMLLMK
ncbi:MAG: hypothetical protein A2V93_07870 [Ignavibacteria bacterium RBG_16_34_14]|nr:MAG: hypothetical protein A2V93_07870 [Ignavibacteria bacterium RBG_16_34_14]